MSSLKEAITMVEIVVAVMAAMALGDYLGYKVGRRKLAVIVGIIALVTIVIFATYAAVVLA
ncbi:MAG: hypothetical protein V1767_02330 [Chloroflexota bacterium]